MRKLLAITWNDLRQILSDRGTMINLFGISTVIMVVVGFASGMLAGGGETPALLVDAIDRDGSELSAQLLNDIRAANENIVLCPADNDDDDVCQLDGAAFDETQAQMRLEEQTSLGLIVIPDGFAGDLEDGGDVTVTYRANADTSAPSYIVQAVQAATQRIGGAFVAERVGGDILVDLAPDTNADLRQAVYERADALWAEQPIRVETTVTSVGDDDTDLVGTGMGQSAPGVGSMYVMFTVLPLLAALIRERENWTLQRLVIAPVSKTQILGGKMLARFTVGMVQYIVLFGVAALLGTNLGSRLPAIALTMIAYVLCITGLAMALSTFVKNEAQASGISLFLTLTLAPLGGAWWPLEIVPRFMQVAGHISPVAWAMDSYKTLIWYGGGLGDVLLPIGALLAMTVVFFAFGTLRFKYE